MEKKNCVFIGTSLDGYIADKKGGIGFLDIIPNPDHDDMGYFAFTSQIDAMVMGRTTFETVCGFGIDWPFKKPVFVLSNTWTKITGKFKDKAQLLGGPVHEVLEQIHQQGYGRLYIDGGVTIQNFLKEDLIDEMVITTIPVLIGGGFSLFGDLPGILEFECVESKRYLGKIVQNHFRRVRGPVTS